MKKIDEQIQWYDQNAARKEDDLIKANLKLINNLFEEVESSDDRIFMDKIIGTFCEIMEIQRDVIADLLSEAEQAASYVSGQSNSTTAYTPPAEGFSDDRHLQTAFTAYLSGEGKSTYTINDYCSRIKNLWKTFYKDYKDGALVPELSVIEEKVVPEHPLLNAYHHIDELDCYISLKLSVSEGKRNWANARAALNKFCDFAISNQNS